MEMENKILKKLPFKNVFNVKILWKQLKIKKKYFAKSQPQIYKNSIPQIFTKGFLRKPPHLV